MTPNMLKEFPLLNEKYITAIIAKKNLIGAYSYPVQLSHLHELSHTIQSSDVGVQCIASTAAWHSGGPEFKTIQI